MKEEHFNERKAALLLALIKDKSVKPMRLREMAGFLQVPKSERGDLSAILDRLIKDGKVKVDSEGRYHPGTTEALVGEYMATDRGFGFVRVEGEKEDIFIPEGKEENAIHGDRVEVRITAEGSEKNGKRTRPEGIVTKIVERGLKEVVGMYLPKENFGFVNPDNRKLPFDIYIAKEHTKGAVKGQKVVAKITDYGKEGRNPEGRITEILGDVNDPGVDILSIAKAYGIPETFPEDVALAAEAMETEVNPSEYEGRKDCRNLLTVTIDGEDAKDLDDAITLTKENGHYFLGVHIADVSHYVTEDSALDREAVKRGTSVYLTDRVIPMLPKELSNGICSLNAGKDRLALSCLMEIDENGKVLSHEICETVIRVDRRMSYTEVNAVITDRNPEMMEKHAEFVDFFFLMAELSKILRERRTERGSIDFDFPEAKIVLDEKGRPIDIHPYERNAATELIEDFMLLANETVAEEFYWLQVPFVFRVHEKPDAEKINSLNILLANFGYHIRIHGDEIHPNEYRKLMEKIAGTPEEALISRLSLRSMKQARYSTECSGHFGLAANYYCHFTSPIRRYPDLQIHRIIKEQRHGKLNEKRISHYEEILDERASSSSRAERRADEAERETEKLKKAQYMRKFLGEEFEGVISGVTNWGFYVELPNTCEGLVRMTDLRDDFYRFSEETMSLVGEKTGKIYALGQKVWVQVQNTDILTHTIEFFPLL